MSQLRIAITGMNARPDNPGPGLAVAHSLRDAPEFEGRLIGLGYDALDPGFYLPQYCDVSYLLPYPSAGEEALLARLQQIHAADPFDLLIPCLDAELPSMIRLQPVLEQMGIKLFIPSGEQLQLRNKDRLHEVAKLAGIDCPEIQSVTQAGFFYRCQEEGWSYPLVVKGLFYDAKIAHSADEAAEAFHSIAAQWGLPVLVQRFVKGEEVNLTGLGDGKGNLLGSVMMRKKGVTDKGKAWAGIAIHDQTLLAAAEKLVKNLDWRGPLEVEVMRDDEGRYHLIEINPRFPAWVYFSAGLGRNLPYALVRLALGEELEEFAPPKPGMLYIRYADECVVPLAEYESVVMNGCRI